MTDTIELSEIAAAMRIAAYNAYACTLIGTPPGIVVKAGDRIKNPQRGDWVIETSSIWRGQPHIDGIGILDAVEMEPVDFNDPDFVWDEASEGRPHPTERVYYLRTMDGRRFRWTNASIVAVYTDLVK
jgi:PAS domain-containing protein